MMEISVESTSIRILPDGRMTAQDAARYLGLADKTLAMLRSMGGGPVFIKKGRIFYFRDDLDAWLEEGRASSTSEHAAKTNG